MPIALPMINKLAMICEVIGLNGILFPQKPKLAISE
jgi:hypothetical protein